MGALGTGGGDARSALEMHQQTIGSSIASVGRTGSAGLERCTNLCTDSTILSQNNSYTLLLTSQTLELH